MNNNLFVTAGDVPQELGISKPFVCKFARELNEEPKDKGFMTISGRVSREYYKQKFYGFVENGMM